MGLCVGGSQSFCINSQLPEEDQLAAIDFLTWLFSSDTGKNLVAQKLQLVTPFSCMEGAEYTNPLFGSEAEISPCPVTVLDHSTLSKCELSHGIVNCSRTNKAGLDHGVV